MRFVISSLVALSVAVLGVAQTPTGHPLVKPFLQEPRTNAKRFAIGLPPLPPQPRHRIRAGTKADTARRSTASPSPPVFDKCNLLVKRVDNGAALGYVAPRWPGAGVYGGLQEDQANALEVSLKYATGDSSSLSQMDMLATNSPNTTFSYIGIAPSSLVAPDLAPGTRIMHYVVGTVQVPGGSPPVLTDNSYSAAFNKQSKVESAVWNYNPITRMITPQWINVDGSAPTTYLVYNRAALLIFGDVSELEVMYPDAAVVTFTCVPSVTS